MADVRRMHRRESWSSVACRKASLWAARTRVPRFTHVSSGVEQSGAVGGDRAVRDKVSRIVALPLGFTRNTSWRTIGCARLFDEEPVYAGVMG
jgi:hypothetical protein